MYFHSCPIEGISTKVKGSSLSRFDGVKQQFSVCTVKSMEFTVIDNRLWLSVLFRKDCNGAKYDTQEAACCGNKLYPGASLSCCGKEPYNPEKATCCKVQDGNTLRGNELEI